ncbi:uncharacterized protein EHS24_002900 [Apiotrichum porosum]|uniref:Uncharacterized protein n=1 Tax=Apiotrichum porosum TaxID=105984 RepID=A0A427XG16_9TREE|nr:uncharacterized protein EHS24_002900 [Apiotrichum porosum]RSH77840.1 hypothetical protein EHS24_002900 [Apiotrichum porosum]
MSAPATELPNGSTNPLAASTSDVVHAPPPPEIEATLQRLSAYRNVRGVMILARSSGQAANAPTHPASGILQSTGAVFEGESGRRYAGALEAVVNATAGAVSACDEGVSVKG